MSTPAKAPPKVEHPTIEALRMFLRNPSAIAGMAMLFIVLVVSIAGPWVFPADPFEIKAAPLTPPFTEEAWLGTDYLGRDVLTTLVYGGRATLLVGAVAALLSVAIGITLGAMAGYVSLWSVYWVFKQLTGKEGMGHGDFKLLAALGAWCGLAGVLPTILLSSLVGAVVGSIWLAAKGRDKATPIPFGPYLAIAGWISFMWGKDLVGMYMRFAGLA